MYEVILINNGIETIIHYPTADGTAPHLIKIPFKESLSLPDILSFSLYPNNIGYNMIEGLITRVKVIDTTNDKVVFVGRAMPVKSSMDSTGLFYKEVSCEGAMAYLNDTQTRRWNLKNQTPTQIITYLLNAHNSKIDASRKIYIGTVNVTQPITLDTNYETTLNTIISKVRNILGGDLKVRETNGLLYLDYLISQGADNGVEIKLGYNMKSLIEEYDPLDIITRGIVLGYGEGINQLDIKKVNNNIEYLDNLTSIAKYGVIEGLISNLDIQNADTLKVYGNTVLAEKSQARLTLGMTSLDLSVSTGHENEKYLNGDNIKVLNEFMNIDVIARVIEREFDLLSPQDKTLTISTRAIKLTDQLIELKQRNSTLENAPQGSTYIDTFGYAENIDASHNFQLPVWISPDVLNVNRVRLHIDGQKYRAYEKGMAYDQAAVRTTGQSSITTSGASSASSSAGGGYYSSGASSTSSSAGGGYYSGGASSQSTSDEGGTGTSNSGGTTTSNASSRLTLSLRAVYSGQGETANYPGTIGDHYHGINHDHDISHTHTIDSHTHTIDNHHHGMAHTHMSPVHDHNIEHTHMAPVHDHNIEHTHGMGHTHDIDLPTHSHELDYGIFEDSYPDDVYVKIDGATVAGPFSGSFSEDLDISAHIGTPGATYNLEVTSSGNGRVNVWVSIQAFIQAK